MFGLFKKRGIPPRHRSAAYMNLAFQRLVTEVGFDVTPTPLEMLTNGITQTPITTGGEETGATGDLILDLGGEYEVYEILIHSGVGGGYMSGAGNTGEIELQVAPASGVYGAVLATQTDVTGILIPIALNWTGNGQPVQFIRIRATSDTVRPQLVRPSEIEVFGC